MVSSKPFVGTSPRTNIYLLLLPASTDELFSTPKIKTFLSQSKSGYEQWEQESNPRPHPK